MSHVAISLKNISKSYPLPRVGSNISRTSILNRLLGEKTKKNTSKHQALKNINFELNKGEAVGILGPNGAGKSTLLQIISGIITPDTGTMSIHGKTAALLELGTSFNAEFSGKENVELACSLLGMTAEEIRENISDIEAFADIGDFFNLPIKTYSTGMAMRLAFAANTAVEPDILIVDEALSVGDARFQAKCYRRLNELMEKGTTLLLVSHDIGTIRNICDTALWLQNGSLVLHGKATYVCDEYQKYCLTDEVLDYNSRGPDDTLHVKDSKEHSSSALKERPITLKTEIKGYGNKEVEIVALEAFNGTNIKSAQFLHGDALNINVTLLAHKPVSSDFIFGVLIRDVTGRDIFAANNYSKVQKLNLQEKCYVRLDVRLPILLTHQSYSVLVAVFGFENGSAFVNGKYDFDRAKIWHVIEEAFFFEVLPNTPIPLNGPVHTKLDLTINY